MLVILKRFAARLAKVAHQHQLNAIIYLIDCYNLTTLCTRI